MFLSLAWKAGQVALRIAMWAFDWAVSGHVTEILTGIPTELAARLPADLAERADPTQLLNEEARAGLLAEIGEAGLVQILTTLPEALAVAITNNFWISVGVGVISLVAVVTLREKRLRTGEHDLPEVPEGALRPQPGAVAGNGAAVNGVLGSGWTDDPAPVARIRPQQSFAGRNGPSANGDRRSSIRAPSDIRD